MENHRGYTAGNSVLASEIGGEHLFENVRYNPPSFEFGKNGIVPIGSVSASLTVDGVTVPLSEMTVTENTYPLYRAEGSAGNVRFSFCTFAPVTPGKAEDMFLPFILMRFSVEAAGEHTVSLGLCFETDEKSFVRVMDEYGEKKAESAVTFTEKADITALFGVYSPDNPHASNHTPETLSAFGIENYDALRRGLDRFIAAIPRLGNGKVWEYTRWYTQAAVMLTKADKSGTVITMGYSELNQRDSFWTTFMHLMYFPDLERKMIEISAAAQSETGKIPTTILPLIEREYDIDINEYFCLRIARYHKYHGDTDFLRKLFPAYKKSVEFLISRDRDGDGLPEQEPPENPECYWGDWKDVSYVVGRKLAPHFCLLWLATLKEGAVLARKLCEEDIAARYEAIYEKASAKINAPFDGTERGGMFLGDHYVEIWYDGILRDHVLEDQTAGIFFDVVPEEKIPLIYSALGKNECGYGIRETFPYREGEEVWNRGGTYHNGGIWPWLMFCDLAGRYKNGRKEEALRYAQTLGYYDLEVPGDYRPNEYLDAENGMNCGMEVQGWSSAIWAMEYVKRITEKTERTKK